MKCPRCHTTLSEGAKFCHECGQNLYIEASLFHTRPTPEGERKRVTALFSDISDYTSMTSNLDPEEVKEITGNIFSGVRKVVRKYDGFIERFAGDGVLALFGVPKTHEDDPIRAIHAAIEINDLVETLSSRYEIKIGRALSMHSGVNTGLAVTADVNPAKGTHGVTGDAINVAARLSDIARACEILVGPDTHKACRGHFDFEPLKPAMFKGKSEPIPIYKVRSSSICISQGHLNRKVSSEMVGRSSELEQLELQVAKVIRGEGSVINVTGEAGIGKSRLIAEMKNLDVMKKVTLLEGRAISIGKNLSFHPIIDLLKQWARIAEDDSDSISRAKLEKTIRRICANETNEIFPFVATMMGMKLEGRHSARVKGIEGEGLEKLILKNVSELIIKGSEVRPTVIVMEDLHWADASSIELMGSLYRLAEKYKIIFVNVFRPGYFDDDEGVVVKVGERLPVYYIELKVRPLNNSNSEVLINNMLEIRGLPYGIRNQIVQRAGGNPFFIEEVVRSLIDTGAVVRINGGYEVTGMINKVSIPPTINDVLIARIDRLEEYTRELVKIASVIGRSFFDRVIKDVADRIADVDERLIYLKDVQLIRDRTRMQELEYLFKHALAQEAAYESTLLAQRKKIHLNVAKAIERLFKDRLREFYGLLAFHYNNADELEKAEEYMMKAGEEALRSSASSEAIAYFLKALKLYTDKHVETADPKRIASFEKNIAIAYFNKAKYTEAVHYFDKYITRNGKRKITNKYRLIANLVYNILILLLNLYLPWQLRRRIPDHIDNEFYDLAIKKDKALGIVNPKRCAIEMIGEYKESLKYDLTKLPAAAGLHLTVAGMFSYAGFLRIAKLVLKNAGKLIDHQKASDTVSFQHVTTWYNYMAGKWLETLSYDQSMFELGIKHGLFWDVAGCALWFGSSRVYQGKFDEAGKLIENLIEMEQQYQFRSFSRFALAAELIVVCRKSCESQAEIDYFILESVERESRPFELLALGWKAVTEVLMGNTKAAENTLNKAEMIRKEQTFWPAWYAGSSLLGQFMHDLQILEDKIATGKETLITEKKKAALESGRKAVKNSASYAAYRPENYRLMGIYYWIIGKQKKALKWFNKSIKESKRLGAMPDLSRTYMEVGKRLLQPNSKYSELNGINPMEFIDYAEKQFMVMDLQWDMKQLKSIEHVK